MGSDAPAGDAIELPFDVPGAWGVSRLSSHCEFVRDGDWIESKDQSGDDYRLLQVSNIGLGRFVETGNYRWVTEETFRRLNCTEIQAGDVLVARMPKPTGRAWHVRGLPWRSVTAVDVAIVRVRRHELEPRFLAYFLNSPACLGLVRSLTTGTTRLRVRRADIERLQIPVPPLPEQRAIAHVLGTLDDKIELNRRMSETLEAMARALFKSWFVDFDPVRAKAEGAVTHASNALTDLFPNDLVESESGPSPRGWRSTTWGAVVSLAYGKALSGYNDSHGDVPVFGTNGRIGWTDVPLCNHPGIVIGRKGAYRGVHYCNRPFHAIDTAFFVEPRTPTALRWAYYEMKRLDINGMDSGSAIPSTSRDEFHRLPVLVPPLVVQREFVRLLGPMWDRQELLAEESRTLASIRDSLLPKLVSGEIRIPDAERFAEVPA